MCVSIIHIQTLVHELQSKQFFYKLAYLTLTFDLVTLTLGQLLHLIDINHVCKYHLYLIISSWYIVKTSFSQNCIFDLDLWPCDLDLRSTLTSHWYQSYVQVSSISNLWFMAYSQISFLTNLYVWPWPLTLWPWPLVNFNISIILIMCMCIINVQSLVHDI